jgi:predicted TPR repeat methyltransferase
MGEIYIRQAKYQHADIAMTASVHTEPTVDYWWTRCGYAREMAGSYQTALDAYNKALELNASQTEAARGKDRCTARLR